LKRVLPWAVVAVAIAIATVALAPVFGRSGAEPAGVDPGSMNEILVARKMDRRIVESTGNLAAVRSSDLAFAVSGRVASIVAGEGTRLAKGAVIARLEDVQQRYQLAVAQANLESARIAGTRRDAELYALEVGFRAADLDKTVLRMPFDGVVASIAVSVGDTVGAATLVARVIDRSSLVGTLEIDEIDLPTVRIGQKVRFEVDALPGRSFDAVVSFIPPEGSISSEGIVVFKVEATIESPPEELLPGYSFTAIVTVGEPREYLWLPKGALKATAEGFIAMVRDGDGSKAVKVEAIALDDGSFEVVSGLAEGAAVLAAKAERTQRQGGFGIPGIGPMPGGRP
jgi:multidrug efflux pump subunit AcrA (membrane-fusion protein)